MSALHHHYVQYAPSVIPHYPPPPAAASAAPAPTTTSPAPPQQQTASPASRPLQPTPASSGTGTVAPNDTYTRSPATTTPAPQATPLIAQGDWTKNLVHLAKTAELKKHALTLQLHTAHIISAQGQLDAKNKALQDIKDQKSKLEAERTRLLNCLREVNEDRDKADLTEQTIVKEVNDLRTKIQTITDGEYTVAKREVDALRAELGQPPAPSLQQTLEEKNAAYLKERLASGPPASADSVSMAPVPPPASASASTKHSPELPAVIPEVPMKRPRGRPKGSKNKSKLG